MLSEANSRLLCDVTDGTAMSNAFRRFWMPVMRGPRLEAGGDPVKFMIAGRSYVAFRGANGEIAVFDERCPHRGCSLELAHARDDSLICIFHGWKFHVSGRCVETPNEPDPDFPGRVPLRGYPVREAGGAVWAYLGEGAAPQFPDLIFNRLSSDRVYSRMAICDYNWLSGLEAILDPSHVGLLHRNWLEQGPKQGYSADINLMGRSLAPALDFEDTPYGFRYAALREMADGSTYMRVSECIMPNGVFIANSRATRRLFICSVPIDTYRSIQWYFWHSPDEPMPQVDRAYAVGGTDPDDDNMYQSLKGKPRWGQDRAAMRRGENFTGFYDIQFEDFVTGEAQGAWPDRRREFLGTADRAIMYARRYILDRLKSAGGDGDALAPAAECDYAAIQAVASTVPNGTDWREIVRDLTGERARRYGEADAQ